MQVNKKSLELEMARACMNAKDISEASNMPESTVKNVISGRNVKPRTLGKIAKALGCDPLDIIEQEE